MSIAGIILCGGLSLRMGRPKDELVAGTKTLLEKTVDELKLVATSILIAGRADQQLPVFDGVSVVRDEAADRGPLEGLRVALKSLVGMAEFAFVVSVDMPEFDSRIVPQLAALIESHAACVPRIGGQTHPLCALYRCDVFESIDRQLITGEFAVRKWLQTIGVRWVDDQELNGISFRMWTNINTPEDLDEWRKSI